MILEGKEYGNRETNRHAGRRHSAASKSVSAKLALVLAIALSAHAGEDAVDSLRALRVLISSEMKTGNEVFELKDARLSDSLLSHPSSRGSFLKGLRDSAVSRPVRGPEEFRSYWERIEKENGIGDLKGQMAAHDVDKGRIPKTYLFDSSVVVYPGWIIVRRMRHR